MISNPQLLDRLEALQSKALANQVIITTAESVTAGGIAYFLTSLDGASGFFDRSFVTYNNQAKQAMLGVKPQTLTDYGAVSSQVAIEMAQGALSKSQANIALSITGYAGAQGDAKYNIKAGTIFIATATANNRHHTQQYNFNGSRTQNRETAIEAAIRQLEQAIESFIDAR